MDTAPPLATGPIPIYFSHSNILVDWKQRIEFAKNLWLAASIFGWRFLRSRRWLVYWKATPFQSLLPKNNNPKQNKIQPKYPKQNQF